MNKVISKIYNNFEIGEPIFPKEIIGLFDLSRQQIYLYLKEGIKLNQIRKSNNYYYIPKIENVCGIEDDNRPTYRRIIEKMYIKDKNKVYGIYAGRTLENKLNISEQVPVIEEIISNNTTRAIKEKEIDGNKIILKRPYIKITENNVNEYTLLQLFNDIDKNLLEDKVEIIQNYIVKNKIRKKEINKLIKKFPNKTKNKIENSKVVFYE